MDNWNWGRKKENSKSPEQIKREGSFFTDLEIRSEKMKQKQLDKWEGDTPLDLYFDRKMQTFKLSKEQYKKWSGPIVYICWKFLDIEINSLGSVNRRNKQYKIALYVGKSSCGMSRPMGRDHHRKNIIEIADQIEILSCESNRDSISLEEDLIKYLRPNGNFRQKVEPRKILRIL